MGLWRWALEAYARPGVPEVCLALQDDHGQNTCLLLWAVWAEGADSPALEEAARVARAWEETVLTPIRSARRALKPAFPPVNDGASEDLRSQVKAVELQAERVLLETLERLGEGRGGQQALQALKAASRAWGNPAPDEALARLAGALS